MKMDEGSDKTETGILFKPQGAKEHLYRKATILKTSDGWAKREKKDGSFTWRLIPCPFKPGMRILFPFYYGEKTFEKFRKAVDDPLVIMLKPEDVLLYDDPSLEGRGLDDIVLSPGEM